MLFIINVVFLCGKVKYNGWLVSNLDTDGLVLWRQDSGIHDADYAYMRFQWFMVW